MRRYLLAIVILFALVAGACSSDDDGDATAASSEEGSDTVGNDLPGGEAQNGVTSSRGEAEGAPGADEDATEAPAESAPEEPAPPDQGGGTAPVPVLQPIDIGRDIIFTATLTLEADNVAAASQQAMTAIEGLGGLVFAQQSTSDPVPNTVITFKVQPSDFQEALRRLGEVGELRNQTVTADDVTERVVDLESRIITSEASVGRLRGFLENATDLETVARLEAQLLERETNLELLRGQLRTVQGQVALATITVTIAQASAPVPEPAVDILTTAYTGHDDGKGCSDSDFLAIDEGDDITICYEVTNTGDSAFVDVSVRNSGLGVRASNIEAILGDPDRVEPGERVLFILETTADVDWRFAEGDISLTPVDANGDPVNQQVERTSLGIELDVAEDTSLPGFTDALSGGFGALVTFLSVLLLALGGLLPFIWVPVLAFFAIRWWRNRAREDESEATTMPPAPTVSTP